MTKILIDKETVELAIEALENLEEHLPFDWAFDELKSLSGKDEYRKDLAKARGVIPVLYQVIEQAQKQEPVAAQCKFDNETTWGWCSVEHHNLVQSENEKWPQYNTRLLYTQPQEAVGFDKTVLDEWTKEYKIEVDYWKAKHDELLRVLKQCSTPQEAAPRKPLTDDLTDRERSVLRYALYRFASDSRARLNDAAQDNFGHYKQGSVEAFAKDAKDADALLAKLKAAHGITGEKE